MGTVGNAQNALALIIAENEEDSPFEPLSVRRSNAPAGMGYGFGSAGGGNAPKFKRGDNVVTLFTGWGILSAANWKVNVWGPDMNYPQIIKDIYGEQNPGLFGTFVVLSPPIANFVKDAGYDTVEKLTEWVTGQAAGATAAAPKAPPGWAQGAGPGGAAPKAKSGGGGFGMGSNFTLIVTGASNNNYWMIGGMRPGRSVEIDKWR
jgi:hypothetical protein